MCGLKGYALSAFLVINRVWFLYSVSSFNKGIILKESRFYIIFEKKINKNLLQIMLRLFEIGLNMGASYNADLKRDFDGTVRS